MSKIERFNGIYVTKFIGPLNTRMVSIESCAHFTDNRINMIATLKSIIKFLED